MADAAAAALAELRVAPPAAGDAVALGAGAAAEDDVTYSAYTGEEQIVSIMRLVSRDLSEPYSIFTYRYFLVHWPHLCVLAMHRGELIGVIICKADMHRDVYRGYIGMLAVDRAFRNRKIGTRLAVEAVGRMKEAGCQEVVLEAEIHNRGALRLYEQLGFARDKRLSKYYLSGVDAYRLKLWLV